MSAMKCRFFAATAVVLLSSLPSLPSQAGSGSVGAVVTQDVVPRRLEVSSDGSRYTDVNPFGNLVAELRVHIKTKGWINDWRTWLKIGTQGEPLALWANFDEHPFAQSFHHGPRPREVIGDVEIRVPAAAYRATLAHRCNSMANVLRSQGLSDEEIFAEDRIIEMGVRASLQWDSNPFGYVFDSFIPSDDERPWDAIQKFDLICKASTGTSEVLVPEPPTRKPPTVESAGLTLAERSGISGVCKIILSGVIRTSKPNIAVRFRYKDDAGRQSEIYRVTTDQAGVARFSHEYPIANNPDGGESGRVRMVGVSHSFETAKQAYDMDCVAPGPGGLQTLLPPALKMRVVPMEKVMVGRQLCVRRVRIEGEIIGRGPASGHAGFVGDGYASWPQPYAVDQGSDVQVRATRELDWTLDPQSFQSAGSDSDQSKSQTIEIGFNVTGADNRVIASLPKQNYTFKCMIRSTDVQAGQGGYSAAPRPEPAPAGERALRLVPQAGDPGPRRPTPAPALPLHLKQQVPAEGDPAPPLRRLQRQRLD